MNFLPPCYPNLEVKPSGPTGSRLQGNEANKPDCDALLPNVKRTTCFDEAGGGLSIPNKRVPFFITLGVSLIGLVM